MRRWWGRRRRGKLVAEQGVVCEAVASFPSQMSMGHLGTGTPRWERVANQAVKMEEFWAKDGLEWLLCDMKTYRVLVCVTGFRLEAVSSMLVAAGLRIAILLQARVDLRAGHTRTQLGG